MIFTWQQLHYIHITHLVFDIHPPPPFHHGVYKDSSLPSSQTPSHHSQSSPRVTISLQTIDLLYFFLSWFLCFLGSFLRLVLGTRFWKYITKMKGVNSSSEGLCLHTVMVCTFGFLF